MAQSRAPVYLGLVGLSAGAFYLYRAGGDPKTATQELKGMLPLLSLYNSEKKAALTSYSRRQQSQR